MKLLLRFKAGSVLLLLFSLGVILIALSCKSGEPKPLTVNEISMERQGVTRLKVSLNPGDHYNVKAKDDLYIYEMGNETIHLAKKGLMPNDQNRVTTTLDTSKDYILVISRHNVKFLSTVITSELISSAKDTEQINIGNLNGLTTIFTHKVDSIIRSQNVKGEARGKTSAVMTDLLSRYFEDVSIVDFSQLSIPNISSSAIPKTELFYKEVANRLNVLTIFSQILTEIDQPNSQNMTTMNSVLSSILKEDDPKKWAMGMTHARYIVNFPMVDISAMDQSKRLFLQADKGNGIDILNKDQLHDLFYSSVISSDQFRNEGIATLSPDSVLTLNLIGELDLLMTVVPNLAGLSREDAQQALVSAGLVWSESNEHNSDINKNMVIEQIPSADSSLPYDSVVEIKLSMGPVMVNVPNLAGSPKEDAQQAVANAGLIKYVNVPNVKGMAREIAVQKITNANLIPLISIRPDKKVPAGMVIEQFSKNKMKANSKIVLFISSGDSWEPSHISKGKLNLWLDASITGHVAVGSNSRILEWKDKSGKNNHARQKNEENIKHRPEYQFARDGKGFPAIKFDGKDDFLVVAKGHHGDPFKIQNPSVIAVAKFNELGDWNNALASRGGSSNQKGGWKVMSGNALNNMAFIVRDTKDDDNLMAGDISEKEPFLVSCRRSSSTKREIGINGAILNTFYEDEGEIEYDDHYKSMIGCGNYKNYLNGSISEIYVVDDLSYTDMRKLEGYLAHKWMLTEKLPDHHPYKMAPPSSKNGPESFSIAVIGDTQVPFHHQPGWDNNGEDNNFITHIKKIIEDKNKYNIKFVAHVGDIIQKPSIEINGQKSLHVAQNEMKKFDDHRIPWSVAFGNHEVDESALIYDVDVAGVAANPYREVFGSNQPNGIGKRENHIYNTHQSGCVEFGGVSENDLNTWHIIKSSTKPDARKYLLLNLEFDIPGHVPGIHDGDNFDAMAWAWDIIRQHPGMPTIILTHVYGRNSEGTFGPPHKPYYHDRTDGGVKIINRNSANDIWYKLIDPNPQIFMVLSGHVGAVKVREKTNSSGGKVLDIVTDWYSIYRRNIEFDEVNREIRIVTNSNGGSTKTIYMDWAKRFPKAPKEGLLAHWKFDKDPILSSGNLFVKDSSINGYDAIISSGESVAGISGNAYNKPNIVCTPLVSRLLSSSTNENVTISTWITPHKIKNWAGIAGFENTGVALDSYSLKMDNKGHINWTVLPSHGPMASSESLLNYPDDEWLHVAGVYAKGKKSVLYVNGKAIAMKEKETNHLIKNSPINFIIGEYSGYQFAGSIDDVQVYNKALSQEEIKFLYNNPGVSIDY